MSATAISPKSVIPRDRLLVVADGGRLKDMLARRYGDLEVRSADTYLAGISDLAEGGARAVLAFVEAGRPSVVDAVAGLREAAGGDTRVVLCCDPAAEPTAREALAGGADDYILYPVRPEELDKALGCGASGQGPVLAIPTVPAASMEELQRLADVLADLDAEPAKVLQRVADMMLAASGAAGVTVVVHGTATSAGVMEDDPVLVEPIKTGNDRTSPVSQTIGQIMLARRVGGAYGPADSEKLRHYGRLIGHVVSAAFEQRKWRRMALTDELSGLPNRRFLLQFLDEILSRAKAEQFRVTLLIFDIDDFKTYNDTCGHEAGDEVIRLAAKLFERHCREHDVVTRFGGDEFAVVFWDADEPRTVDSNHPHDAYAVLKRFTEDLRSAEPAALKNLPNVSITISGGLATYPWNAATRDELIRSADEALLAAKQAGKNRVFTVGGQ